MARSLNIVIGANIEKLRQGFNDAISVIKKAGGEMSADVAKSAKSIEEKLASIATRNPTMGTVRQLTQLAMEARALGPEFGKVADQFIREAGRIKDSIGDARAEVAYFASDTRRIDAVLGGVQAVTGAFGALQGITALLGAENEDMQKAMMKLHAAMSVVSGLQAVMSALEAESTVRKGANVAMTKLQTYVMGQATVAARAYSAALLATGAGAILVAIGLVVTVFQNMSSEIDKAKKRLEQFQKIQERSLTLGQRQIKEEERKTELAISQAKAQGKSEGYILKLKEESLKRQKAIYIRYGNEALFRLSEQRAEEMYLADGNAKKIKEISAKYTQLESDLKYSINQEYKDKVVALDIEKNNQLAENRKDDLKDAKNNAQELAKLEAQVFGQKNTGKAITNPIEDQIKPEKMEDVINSMEMAAPAVKALNDELVGMGGTEGGPAMVATSVGELSAELQAMADTSSVSYKIHAAAAAEATRKTQEYADSFKEAMSGVNQAFNSMTAQGLEDFGVLLGDIMTGQIGSFQDFGKKLLGAVAGFMKSFGQALIATATASKAFKELLIKNPVLAAAAGVALVAGSAVITNMLNKGPQATAFAEGGIVSGPTLGLVGEYPGASSNPEVIAPLDKLKGMLNTNEQSGFVASTTIQGRDLAIVLERYNKDRNRG
jgi:hypothetical protein